MIGTALLGFALTAGMQDAPRAAPPSTVATETQNAGDIESDARKARALALLEGAIGGDAPRIRARYEKISWPVCESPRTPRVDPMLREPGVITSWDAEHWSMDRDSRGCHLRDGPLLLWIDPYNVWIEGRKIVDNTDGMLALVLQSTSTGCRFGWGNDPIEAFREEVEIRSIEERDDRIVVQFTNPVSNRRDADAARARGVENPESDSSVVHALEFDRGSPPRLLAVENLLLKDGQIAPWGRAEVVEWDVVDGQPIGRRVVKIITTGPNTGQLEELRLSAIEPIPGTEPPAQFLPEGTPVSDSRLGLRMTVGSPQIDLGGQTITLREPLWRHPGESLAARLAEVGEGSRDPAAIEAANEAEQRKARTPDERRALAIKRHRDLMRRRGSIERSDLALSIALLRSTPLDDERRAVLEATYASHVAVVDRALTGAEQEATRLATSGKEVSGRDFDSNSALLQRAFDEATRELADHAAVIGEVDQRTLMDELVRRTMSRFVAGEQITEVAPGGGGVDLAPLLLRAEAEGGEFESMRTGAEWTPELEASWTELLRSYRSTAAELARKAFTELGETHFGQFLAEQRATWSQEARARSGSRIVPLHALAQKWADLNVDFIDRASSLAQSGGATPGAIARWNDRALHALFPQVVPVGDLPETAFAIALRQGASKEEIAGIKQLLEGVRMARVPLQRKCAKLARAWLASTPWYGVERLGEAPPDLLEADGKLRELNERFARDVLGVIGSPIVRDSIKRVAAAWYEPRGGSHAVRWREITANAAK